MLKLLLCLTSALCLAVILLQIRQQRMELNYQCNQLHAQIEAQQARLWSQQLSIAIATAPNAISKTVGDQALNMVPISPLPADTANWIDVSGNPDAEGVPVDAIRAE